VNVDECARAADIYQCGVEKAPAVTTQIKNSLASNALLTTVRLVPLIFCQSATNVRDRKLKNIVVTIIKRNSIY